MSCSHDDLRVTSNPTKASRFPIFLRLKWFLLRDESPYASGAAIYLRLFLSQASNSSSASRAKGEFPRASRANESMTGLYGLCLCFALANCDSHYGGIRGRWYPIRRLAIRFPLRVVRLYEEGFIVASGSNYVRDVCRYACFLCLSFSGVDSKVRELAVLGSSSRYGDSYD